MRFRLTAPVLLLRLCLLITLPAAFCAGLTPALASPVHAIASSTPSSSPPSVTISPLPGTPDASPNTQISFLGAPQADLHHILVEGSRTGIHYGKLEGYSTGEGASDVLAKPFASGEQVSVSAQVSSPSSTTRISTHFSVAYPDTLTPPQWGVGHGSGPKVNASYLQSYHSVSFHPPVVSATTLPADPELGDIFLAPDSGPGQWGPMIVEPDGALVWFQPMPSNTEAMDLRLQQYRREPVLTWWQGHIVDGHGQGEDVIENTSYTRISTIHGGNGLYPDLHEFDLTPKGTALITAYEPEHWNLSAVHGPRNGFIDDVAVQEIDVATGLVMFEWHALGHVSLEESYEPVGSKSNALYDFFHLNSIQLEPEGNLLLTARNTWCVYLVSGRTGAVLWRLGGKKSTFAMGPGVRFAWEHDAELLPGGILSVFDDEDSPAEASQSRALYISLDFKGRKATLLRQFTNPKTPILSPSQGNAQLLPGGNELIGWGQAGPVSEFAKTGALTLAMHLPPRSNSYRAYRFPWSAQPSASPSLAVSPGSGSTTELYASWDGATDVSSWQVLAGESAQSLQPVGTFARNGFETAMSVPGSEAYFAVSALGAAGSVLGTSAAVKR